MDKDLDLTTNKFQAFPSDSKFLQDLSLIKVLGAFVKSARMSHTMSYKDASRASPKLAAKYTPPTIDTETFVITNGDKFKVDSDYLGTTDAKSDAWQLHAGDNTIKTLLRSVKGPVYHILTKDHHDMGYDHKGRRCPVVDFIDMYVWSVLEGKPVVYLYEADTHQKSYILRDTFVDPVVIKSLSVEDYWYDEEKDDTFAQVYQRISDILFSQSK